MVNFIKHVVQGVPIPGFEIPPPGFESGVDTPSPLRDNNIFENMKFNLKSSANDSLGVFKRVFKHV